VIDITSIMPREHRKRGKRNKKKPDEEEQEQSFVPLVEPEPEPAGEPSWIRPAPPEQPEINPEAPFGFVDADVKAYFRTVDVQIRDWQDVHTENAGSEDADPNERMSL
jgi:nucleolar protein 9